MGLLAGLLYIHITLCVVTVGSCLHTSAGNGLLGAVLRRWLSVGRQSQAVQLASGLYDSLRVNFPVQW